MSQQVICPHCNRTYRVPEETKGKRLRCRHCRTLLKVYGNTEEKKSNPERPDENSSSEEGVTTRATKKKFKKKKHRRTSGPFWTPMRKQLFLYGFLGLAFLIVLAAGIFWLVSSQGHPEELAGYEAGYDTGYKNRIQVNNKLKTKDRQFQSLFFIDPEDPKFQKFASQFLPAKGSPEYIKGYQRGFAEGFFEPEKAMSWTWMLWILVPAVVIPVLALLRSILAR